MTIYNTRGEGLNLCPTDKSKCINITQHWHNLPDHCGKRSCDCQIDMGKPTNPKIEGEGLDKIMNRGKWQKPLDAMMEAIPEAVRSANEEQKKMVDDSKIEHKCHKCKNEVTDKENWAIDDDGYLCEKCDKAEDKIEERRTEYYPHDYNIKYAMSDCERCDDIIHELGGK